MSPETGSCCATALVTYPTTLVQDWEDTLRSIRSTGTYCAQIVHCVSRSLGRWSSWRRFLREVPNPSRMKDLGQHSAPKVHPPFRLRWNTLAESLVRMLLSFPFALDVVRKSIWTSTPEQSRQAGQPVESAWRYSRPSLPQDISLCPPGAHSRSWR